MSEQIDPVPDLTDEKLAENAEFQKQMRERYKFTPPKDHADRSIQTGLDRIAQFEQMLETADAETRGALKLRIRSLRNETALYLKQTGQFVAAAIVAADPNIAKRSRKYVNAREKDDKDWCDHPKWIETPSGMAPNYFREFDFNENGQQLSMIRCNECGYRNATTLPKDLQKLSEARAVIRKHMADNDMKLPDGVETNLERLANG